MRGIEKPQTAVFDKGNIPPCQLDKRDARVSSFSLIGDRGFESVSLQRCVNVRTGDIGNETYLRHG